MGSRDAIATTNSWQYVFPAPLLDTRPNLHMQPPGTFSRLVGVDGRYATELRRFPGFVKESTLPSVAKDYTAAGAHGEAAYTFGDPNGLEFYKYFSIQEDVNQNGVLRGIIFLGTTGTDSVVYIYYRRDRTSTTYLVKAYVLASVALDFIDISYDHRHFFVVGQDVNGTKIQKMLRFVSDSGDPPTETNELWTTASLTGAPGTSRTFTLAQLKEYGAETPAVYGIDHEVAYLEPDAKYGIAVRIVCPEQDIYGPLSDILEVTAGNFTNGKGYFTLDADLPAGLAAATWATRRYMEFYRTVAHTHSDLGKLGRLFLERRVEVGTGEVNLLAMTNPSAEPTGDIDNIYVCWGYQRSAGPGQADSIGLSDVGLTFQTDLNPVETRVFAGNPTSKLVQEYERLLIHVSAVTATDEGADTEVLRYSPLVVERMNLLPVDHFRKPPDLSDSVLALEKCDPFLAVVYDNSILRMHRTGTQLSLDPIHNRHGAVSGAGVVSLGSNLFLVSEVGLLVADLALGQLDVLPATQHVFDEPGRWRDSLSSVIGAYDSGLGCLVLLNTTKDEVMLVWMNEGVVTMLDAAPFTTVLTGSDLADGGTKKALFLNTASRGLYTIDRSLEAQTRTMNGGPATSGGDNYEYNCQVHDAGADPWTILTLRNLAGDVPESTLLDPSGMTGFYVHFGRKLSDGTAMTGVTGESRIISSVSGDNKEILTLTEGFTVDPTGAMISLCAIPMRLTAWPLWAGDQQDAVDAFRIKKVSSMGSLVRNLSGDSAAGRFLYQTYSSGGVTQLQENEGTITETPGNSFVKVLGNGSVIVPGLECLTSNLQLSLLSLNVIGTHEGTRKG